jgi:seryl-tRNA synthetase
MELGTVLAQRFAPVPPRGGDVVSQALDRGWIIPFGHGQFIYTSRWVSLLRTLQRLVLDRAIGEGGFQEWMFPRLIPTAALESFRLTQFRADLLLPVGGPVDAALDPVQCISLYEVLRGRTVAELPLKVVECLGGWTWRNEALEDLDGPVKATEFARVEHVYLGTPEQVRLARRSVQAGLTGLLSDLGISWQVVAAEGCMEIPSIVEAQRRATDADGVPVQDIEIPLSPTEHPTVDRPPWASGFDRDFDLREIAGCSVEGDHLTASFGITSSDGQPLWSGCCGIGMNRLVTGFLYQHGFEAAEWPLLVREHAGVGSAPAGSGISPTR